MSAERLREYLQEHDVDFEVTQHPRAITAQEVAATEHESGWHVAKPVMIVADDNLAMVVLPAPLHIDLDRARAELGAGEVRLATEEEFADRFDDCDTGAEPPFGNLYDIPVYVDDRLAAEEQVIFNNGRHTETMKLAVDDYLRMVEARRVKVGVPID